MSLMESNSALREKESRHRKECNRLRQALKQQAANCRMVEDDADRYIIGLTGTIVNQREEILRWKREIEQMRRVYDLEIEWSKQQFEQSSMRTVIILVVRSVSARVLF